MEFVYVVPRRVLFPEAYPHGYRPFGSGEESATLLALAEREGFFVERAVAETRPEWKQLIPYTLVAGPEGVMLMERTKAGGDARLHHKLSIGVGGHVNPIDAPGLDDRPTSDPAARRGLLGRAGRRELAEELHLTTLRASIDSGGGPNGRPSNSMSLGGASPEPEPRLCGLINDETNPVGCVHVGLVQVLTVEDARVREVDVLKGRFASPAELLELQRGNANFESWSAQLIDHLDDLLAMANENAGG